MECRRGFAYVARVVSGRHFSLLSVLAVAGLLSGCFVQSLHPMHLPDQEVHVAEIMGHWVPIDEHGVPNVDRGLWRFDENRICVFANDSALKLEWKCFKVGGETFIESTMHKEELEQAREEWGGFWVPTRTLCKVEIKGDFLTLSGLEVEWVKQQSRSGDKATVWPSSEYVMYGEDDAADIFTSSPIVWSDFLTKHAKTAEAFPEEKQIRLVRLKLAPSEAK